MHKRSPSAEERRIGPKAAICSLSGTAYEFNPCLSITRRCGDRLCPHPRLGLRRIGVRRSPFQAPAEERTTRQDSAGPGSIARWGLPPGSARGRSALLRALGSSDSQRWDDTARRRHADGKPNHGTLWPRHTVCRPHLRQTHRGAAARFHRGTRSLRRDEMRAERRKVKTHLLRGLFQLPRCYVMVGSTIGVPGHAAYPSTC